jgi:hypothetical protein
MADVAHDTRVGSRRPLKGATYAMSPFGELYANGQGVAQDRA